MLTYGATVGVNNMAFYYDGVQAGPEHDYFYDRCLGAELKFSLWPRRCSISNKLIWLQWGYRLIAIWTGPGDDAVETRWHDKNEHLIWQLKRN